VTTTGVNIPFDMTYIGVISVNNGVATYNYVVYRTTHNLDSTSKLEII
jgi:hypothetical protein